MKKGTISILALITGAMAGGIITGNELGRKLNTQREMSDKHLSLFLMMDQWVRIHQEGKKLSSYFEKNGYKKIAVYGMSYAGKTLLNELRKTDIQVSYAIDRNPGHATHEITIYSTEDKLEPVDAVVVTAITYFDEIRDVLEEKISCPIISLEDIVFEV